jgi:hypothetical protein
LTICIICGLDISVQRQKSVPILKIEFQPFIGEIEPIALDVITRADSCQDCYARIMGNRAKAIAAYGKIKTEEK